MGKLLFAVVIAALLALGALVVPIEGRTAWQHAQGFSSKDSPAAVARAVAHGFRAGWDWVASARHAGTSAAATHSPPANSFPRHPSRKALARTSTEPAEPPGQSRDGIVKAPPTEQHAPGDRAALDKLVESR